MVIGFSAGALSGLLGIGGGSILVPAMVFLLGMGQHRAHGTSLAAISAIVLSSAIIYSGHGKVDWLVAFELAAGGVVGAAFGAKLCCLVSAGRLRRLFGLFLGIVGIRMLYDVVVVLAASGAQASPHPFSPAELGGAAYVVGVGVLTGFCSGMFGIGGGLVMVPALVLLFGLSQRVAQGISLAVIIPVSISGSFIHSRHGNVGWGVAWWLALGGIVGGLVGSHLAVIRIPEMTLRGMFGLLMLVTGLLMARHRPQS